MPTVYIGIGSNLGDKEAHIKKAIARLGKKSSIRRTSSLYKTEPVGYSEQDWFLNCVVEIETCEMPRDLLVFLLTIEATMGRIRTFKNSPRIIDLDILLYDDLVINEKGLVIPHPRLHERLFVLVPLNEISPKLIHPVFGKSVEEILIQFPFQEGIEIL